MWISIHFNFFAFGYIHLVGGCVTMAAKWPTPISVRVSDRNGETPSTGPRFRKRLGLDFEIRRPSIQFAKTDANQKLQSNAEIADIDILWYFVGMVLHS